MTEGSTPSIQADRKMCIGSGMCAMYAGDVFTQDDIESKVVVIADGDPNLDAIRRAVEACPTQALRFIHT